VGIGSDFTAAAGFRINNVTRPTVTIELVRRGYTENRSRKIWRKPARVWRERCGGGRLRQVK